MTESIEYVQIVPGSTPPTLGPSQPFRAVVIIESVVSPEWQSSISDWLVQSGCLYMMAWGENCSSWDDSVDIANVKQFKPAEIPAHEFVMTTWHEREPMGEVFWFSKNNAVHPTVKLRRTVLIHISFHNKHHELLKAYADA